MDGDDGGACVTCYVEQHNVVQLNRPGIGGCSRRSARHALTAPRSRTISADYSGVGAWLNPTQ